MDLTQFTYWISQNSFGKKLPGALYIIRPADSSAINNHHKFSHLKNSEGASYKIDSDMRIYSECHLLTRAVEKDKHLKTYNTSE